MPIVIIIMPHMRLLSRNILLYLSIRNAIMGTRQPLGLSCGVFVFTCAAQFALHVICVSSAHRIC